MSDWLLVGLVGGLASVARSWLGSWTGRLPWGILLANTLASAIATWAVVFEPKLLLLLVIALAGGLSTFSTFIGQTVELLSSERRMAFWNVLLNVAIPSTAVLLVLLCR